MKTPRIVMALAPFLLAGNGCSSSVNALYLDGTGDAGVGDAAGSDSSAGGQSGGPPGFGPLPTTPQVAYQRAELTAFMHFGLNTFDGTEYGDSSKDTPSLFSPTNLDASQWVNALKAAGFRQAMLVVKHSTGFCLWPSAYTDYSVKNSPWKNGQGDVVRDFTDAAHAAGMRVGFYLSPWDVDYPSSSPNYETYFRNQLSELLSNYGPVDEIYLDGYNAPTSLNWTGIAQLAKQLQSNLLVWMGPEIAAAGADLRWIGNQTGQGSRSTSSVGDVPNGGPSNVWYPPDAPVSDRNPNWFWHPNNTVMSLKSLQTIYFNTVGMNTTLVLNVPPATTGQFDTPDISLLQQFGTWYSSLYQTNLLRGQPTTADSTWESTGFGTANVVDDDVSTYWAASSGARSARIDVTPASAITFSVISIREPIELGERATKYHVEIKRNGTWNRSPTDASGAIIAGTVIGQRQLWQLNSTTADAIALIIDSAKDVPAICEFSVY
jgi:alpha-L-fucosidase